MSAEKPGKTNSVKVPVSMPPELDDKVTEAAQKVGLSKQDTIRLSLERGLAVLVAQLTSTPLQDKAA